jgi:hypothetical protein
VKRLTCTITCTALLFYGIAYSEPMAPAELRPILVHLFCNELGDTARMFADKRDQGIPLDTILSAIAVSSGMSRYSNDHTRRLIVIAGEVYSVPPPTPRQAHSMAYNACLTSPPETLEDIETPHKR